MKDYTKLCQIVDTLKLHFYHGQSTTQKIYNDYVAFVDELKALKEDAQSIHHSNNDMRFVNTTIGGQRFQVMATTISGFAVTLRNQDLSISFKALSVKKEIDNDSGSDEFLLLSPNPIIKIEFRASFLARMQWEKAVSYALRLIETHVVSDYMVKVSELHLATDIQGYNFSILDFQRMKTRKRSNNLHDQDSASNSYFYNARKFTGFSLGNGDEMLRIYNKSVEIKKNPDKEFIKFLAWEKNDSYDPDREVWRIEIQYRRAKLKTMYDSVNGLLDGFGNVLDSIPSLWNKALDSVSLLDLKDAHCLESMLGYSVVDGVHVPIKNETIKKRITRAVVHPLWVFLRGWLGQKGGEVNVYDAPTTASFQWVSNSIKSLFSTLLKHSGELTPKILESAFKRADEELILDKQITLLDNAYINTMSYIGDVEKSFQDYGVYVNNVDSPNTGERSYFNALKFNCEQYVREITRSLFEFSGLHFDTDVNRSRILSKSLERMYA